MTRIILILFIITVTLAALLSCNKAECEHRPLDGVKENIVAATCCEKGHYDNVVYCADCKSELERTTVYTETTEHTPGAAIVKNRIEPTCTKRGSYISAVFCTECAAKISESEHKIARADHSFEDGACTVCSYPVPSEGLAFLDNGDGTYSVSGIGSCTDTDIVIPDEFYGCEVTAVADKAFRSNHKITSVRFPEGLSVIGVAAFDYCTSLKDVYFSSTVSFIHYLAFSSCAIESIAIPLDTQLKNACFDSNPLLSVTASAGAIPYMPKKTVKNITVIGDSPINAATFVGYTALETLVIGDSVSAINELAFESCVSLYSITVDKSNKSFSSDSGNLYSKDQSQLLFYPLGKTDESFYLPNEVTVIGSFAFIGITRIKTLYLPKELKTVDTGAFYNCSGIVDIYYSGSSDDWKKIDFKPENTALFSATLHTDYQA